MMKALVLKADPILRASQVSPHRFAKRIVYPAVWNECRKPRLFKQEPELGFRRRINTHAKRLQRDASLADAVDSVGLLHETLEGLKGDKRHPGRAEGAA